METDGGCADDGDAVQCLVLAGYDGIPTLIRGARWRWGGRGRLSR